MAAAASSDQSLSPTNRRRKKEVVRNHATDDDSPTQTTAQWKSSSQQQLYSTKLRHTLLRSQVELGGGTSAAPMRVRQAADRVLASMAKGRSRWSRAIATCGSTSSRLKLKLMRRNSAAKRRQRLQNKPKAGAVRLKGKDLPAVRRKAKFLGRLVPGCRRQPLNVVLEEASDYIPALEMQVRAMRALADLLSTPGPPSSTHHPTQSGSGQDHP